MKKGMLFRLADRPTAEECKALGGTYFLRVETTGEFRCPKQGEWYVSGAVVEGYRAPANLGIEFHIARLVGIRTKTTELVVRRIDDDAEALDGEAKP